MASIGAENDAAAARLGSSRESSRVFQSIPSAPRGESPVSRRKFVGVSAKMEWNNEIIMEFLRLYEEEPCIWDPRGEGRKNRYLVHDAWKRIKAKFHDGRVPVRELKKKKDNLMATYRKLHAKVQASAKTANDADEIYVPYWPFYEPMVKFLHDVYIPLKALNSENNEDPEMELNAGEIELILENESRSNAESIDPSTFDISTRGDVPGSPAKFTGVVKTQNGKGVTPKKRKIGLEIENAHEVPVKAEPEEDVCALFAKLLCSKLKAMDAATREIAMHEIDNLMFQLKRERSGLQPLPKRCASAPFNRAKKKK